MNNFIANVSMAEIKSGMHENAGSNSMLIQIVDHGVAFPKPNQHFRWVVQMRFDDTEEDVPEAITRQQADYLAKTLSKAKEQNTNVIVHCHAGLCRSGAVVDVGVEMGFNPPDRMRLPNSRVRSYLREALGMAVTAETSMFTQDNFTDGGIIVSNYVAAEIKGMKNGN